MVWQGLVQHTAVGVVACWQNGRVQSDGMDTGNESGSDETQLHVGSENRTGHSYQGIVVNQAFSSFVFLCFFLSFIIKETTCAGNCTYGYFLTNSVPRWRRSNRLLCVLGYRKVCSASSQMCKRKLWSRDTSFTRESYPFRQQWRRMQGGKNVVVRRGWREWQLPVQGHSFQAPVCSESWTVLSDSQRSWGRCVYFRSVIFSSW